MAKAGSYTGKICDMSSLTIHILCIASNIYKVKHVEFCFAMPKIKIYMYIRVYVYMHKFLSLERHSVIPKYGMLYTTTLCILL